MLRRHNAILILTLSGLIAASLSAQVGRHAITKSWQLDVKFHDPQRINLILPGQAEPTTFWYMLYEVTNHTRRDVNFLPSVDLVTNTLQVIRGGDNIHPWVYEAIIQRHKHEFPFLSPPTKVTGKLLQGRANARATVAVFRTFDPEASSFTIYASGFSGEMKRITNPAFDRGRSVTESNPRDFLLRRTLGIDYDLPGDSTTRQLVKPIRRHRTWVMR